MIDYTLSPLLAHGIMMMLLAFVQVILRIAGFDAVIIDGIVTGKRANINKMYYCVPLTFFLWIWRKIVVYLNNYYE